MGLARGRGGAKGGLLKSRMRGPAGKPPPLLGRLALPPGMALRPRGPPVPPLVPRMRPPPPGMRSPRLLPPPLPPVMGPPRPPMPPFHPPPPHGRLLPPPPLPPRPPVPPPSLLRARGQGMPPPMGMRGPGFRPPGPPLIPKFGPGKRNPAAHKGLKKKPKGKRAEVGDEAEMNKPWVTEAMKNEIQKKHKLYQKAKKSNQQADWEEFKEQRNRVTTMIREAKLEYIGNHPEEVGDFFCETCDRQFNSSLMYAEHVAEHQTCGLEGCTFSAHPKMIVKHVENQHLSGLFNRIGNMDSPEDIARWIADRKRHYPTGANVEKKQAERQEKMDRGERLFQDKSRFNRDIRRRGPGVGNSGSEYSKRGRGRGRGRPSQGRRIFNYDIHDEEEVDDFKRNLPCFPGSGILESEVSVFNGEEAKGEFSDSEWEACNAAVAATATTVPVSSTPSACKALHNLMTVYCSDSDDCTPEKLPILNSQENIIVKPMEAMLSESDKSREPAINGAKSCDDTLEDSCLQMPVSGPHHISASECHELELLINNDSNKCQEINDMDTMEQQESDDDAPEEVPILHFTELDCSDNVGTMPKKTVQDLGIQSEASSSKNCDNILVSGWEKMDFNDGKVSESLFGKELLSENMSSKKVELRNDFPNNSVPETRPSAPEGNGTVVVQSVNNRSSKELQKGCMMKDCMDAKDQCKIMSRRKQVSHVMGHQKREHTTENVSRKRRKTLLEKLLAKEILHERNVILQCVRYVVEKQFLGVELTDKEKDCGIEHHNRNAHKNQEHSALCQVIKFIIKKNYFEVCGDGK